MSISYDGRILLWKYDVNKRSLLAFKCYSIVTKDLPKTICKDTIGKSKVGLSAGSVVSRGASNCKLVIGCWGGGLLLCSLEWKEQEMAINSKGLTEKTDSPVVLSFAPHRSNITCINLWRENCFLFLSTSSDGELRVYHLNQSKPVAVYHCESSIVSAYWSLSDSLIYTLMEDSASVALIDFNANEEEENRLISRQSTLMIRHKSENVISFWPNGHKGRLEELALVWISGDIKVIHL